MKIIRPEKRHQFIDRSDTTIAAAWLRSMPRPLVDSIHISVRESATRNEEPYAMVMFDSASDPEVDELQSIVRTLAEVQHKRIYVIAPMQWAPANVPVINRSRSFLVRRTFEVPATGVIMGNTGWLWLGQQSAARLDLTAEQAEATRMLFLRLFWEEAVDEGWNEGAGYTFHEPTERPFDVPDVASSAPVRLTDPDEPLPQLGSESYAQVQDVSHLPDRPPRLLRVPWGQFEKVEKWARTGTRVFGALDFPDVAVDAKRGTIIHRFGESALRIELSSEQADAVAALLRQADADELVVDQRLGDLADARVVETPGSDLLGVLPEQKIDLGALPVENIENWQDAVPNEWPEPDPLALTVRYEWTVVPPYAPKGAKTDPLVLRWSEQDQRWSGLVSEAKKTLDRCKIENEKLAEQYPNLKGPCRGFERTIENLRDKLAVLDENLPTKLGPDRAVQAWDELQTAAQQATDTWQQIERAERREQERIEERQRREEEERRAKKAKVELEKIDKQMEQARRIVKELESELDEVQRGMRTASKREKRDLKVKKARLSDDLVKAKKRVKILGAERKALLNPQQPSSQQSHGKQRGSQVQTNRVKNPFVPELQPQKPPAVPQDPPPRVGTLLLHEKTRYLAIESWEQLPIAIEEASRLGAKLVAKRSDES